MNFETFRGRDVQEALALVRAAFGTDAIIGSTRVVTNGREGGLAQAFVEVKAAASDRPPSMATGQRAFPYARVDAERARDSKSPPARLPSPIAALLQQKSAVSSPRIEIKGASARPAPPSIPPQAPASVSEAPIANRMSDNSIRVETARAESMESEVRALRQLVEQMLTSKGTPKDRVLAELTDVGIEGKVATELSASAAKVAKESSLPIVDVLRDRLEKKVGCTEIRFQAGKKHLLACVGPTGVGKTTTLAKLAAHTALSLGLPTAIITLDTFRVGAIEQMKRFASLIDVPFFVAHDEASLLDALRKVPDVVFVDTPSRGPKDEAAMSRLSLCLDSIGNEYERDVLLAIPAHMRASDTQDLVRSYSRVAPTACVLTKLDETKRRGGAVAGAIAARLDIAFLSEGPKVPEDLKRATPNDVALAVLPKVEPYR